MHFALEPYSSCVAHVEVANFFRYVIQHSSPTALPPEKHDTSELMAFMSTHNFSAFFSVASIGAYDFSANFQLED